MLSWCDQFSMRFTYIFYILFGKLYIDVHDLHKGFLVSLRNVFFSFMSHCYRFYVVLVLCMSHCHRFNW